jgi:hypothetical protein
MTKDDQSVCGEIKTPISFMVGRLAKKDTPGASRGELMWRGDEVAVVLS